MTTSRATEAQRRSAVVENEVGAALRAIDARILGDGTKETLEVNRPGRVVPHYQFVPSEHHPDPWGVANYKASVVHKKTGKKRDSRRKGK